MNSLLPQASANAAEVDHLILALLLASCLGTCARFRVGARLCEQISG